MQVFTFILRRFLHKNHGHTAIGKIIPPGMTLVVSAGLVEFLIGQRGYADLISPPPELGQNI